MAGVYKIKNTKNGYFYIGSSEDAKYRIRKHFEALRRGKHKNLLLQDAFNNDSEFIVSELIIEGIDRETAYDIEDAILKRETCEYNTSKNARGGIGWKIGNTFGSQLKGATVPGTKRYDACHLPSTDTQKEAAREAQNKRWAEAIEIKCPHCDAISKSMGMLKRWHFDNCKNK